MIVTSQKMGAKSLSLPLSPAGVRQFFPPFIDKLHMIILLIPLFMFQCKQYKSAIIKDNVFVESKTGLNYSKTSYNSMNAVIDYHYRINMEIEKPYIISYTPLTDLPPVYGYSGIEGVSVLKVKINNKGKIISYKIVKRAGLGLDEIAVKIFKNIKISPLFHKSIAGSSDIILCIYFKGINRI